MHGQKEKLRRLIVNADDFGLNNAINAGIIDAFKNGIVTNVSLLSCGEGFDDAVSLAKDCPRLGTGIHIAINEERPLLKGYQIKSLTDDKGYFLKLPVFLKRYFSGRISLNEIAKEFEAQIKKFVESGLRPTHLDSHKHIHLLPGIFEISLELTKKFGITRIRLCNSPLLQLTKLKFHFRNAAFSCLSVLSNLQAPKARGCGIISPDYCYGLIESGNLDKYLAGILNSLSGATIELVCHPGYANNYLLNRYDWNYNWQEELAVLKDPKIRKILTDLDIKLIRYDEI